MQKSRQTGEAALAERDHSEDSSMAWTTGLGPLKNPVSADSEVGKKVYEGNVLLEEQETMGQELPAVATPLNLQERK